MLTIPEFNAAADQNRRQVMLMLGVPIAILGAGVLVFELLAECLHEPGQARGGGWVGVLGTVMEATAAIAFIVMVTAYCRRVKDDERLRCPHCRCELNTVVPAVVIATRRCRRCGQRVLAEPDEFAGPALSLTPLDDFRLAAHAHRRRTLAILVGALVVCLGAPACVCVAILIAFCWAGADGVLTLVESVPVAAREYGVLSFALLVVVGVVCAGCLNVLVARRDRRLLCCHCGKNLGAEPVARQAMLTRNCGRCGRKALSEPPESVPGHGQPLLDLDQIKRARAAYERRVLLMLAAPVCVGILGCLATEPFADVLSKEEADLFAPAAMPTQVIRLMLVAVPVLLTFAVSFAVHERRTYRDRRILCPHCGGLLLAATDPMLKETAGICTHCGRQAVALPVPAATVP